MESVFLILNRTKGCRWIALYMFSYMGCGNFCEVVLVEKDDEYIMSGHLFFPQWCSCSQVYYPMLPDLCSMRAPAFCSDWIYSLSFSFFQFNKNLRLCQEFLCFIHYWAHLESQRLSPSGRKITVLNSVLPAMRTLH
jgi:hypothetical protein